MTAQVNDTVMLKGQAFALIGVEGKGLFQLSDVGLKAERMSTACHRGFFCVYIVKDSLLVLQELTFRVAYLKELALKSGKETVFGRIPQASGGWMDGLFLGNLSEPIRFSGGLLLGDGFIQELYVHMGFQAPYKYQRVFELTLEGGVLLDVQDRSEQMAKIRQKDDDGLSGKGSPVSDTDRQKWIEESFSRRYRRYGV